jgi:hypothetical protein
MLRPCKPHIASLARTSLRVRGGAVPALRIAGGAAEAAHKQRIEEEYIALPAEALHAAESDVASRARIDPELQQPWSELSVEERIRVVRRFISDADAARMTPIDLATLRCIERGDMPVALKSDASVRCDPKVDCALL